MFRSPVVFTMITVAAVSAAAGWIGGIMVTKSQALRIAGVAAAQVGDRTITLAEVDDRWRQDEPREQGEAMRLLYAGRRAALQRLIVDAIIADGATYERVPVAVFIGSESGEASAIAAADRPPVIALAAPRVAK